MYEVIHKEQGYLVKKLIIKSKAELSLQSHKKRTLIIFTEGTRVPYGEKSHIKKGVLKILDFLKIHFLIMNHDAGRYWNKSSFIIKPGIINIKTQSLNYTDDINFMKEKIAQHFY